MEVLRHMNEYRKSNRFCDVLIVVGEVKFNAHKAVLAAGSEYFAEALDNDSSEILVESLTSDDIETALNFLYTGKIEIVKENLESLFSIAETLKIAKLKDRCQKFKEIEDELALVESEVPEPELPQQSDPDFVIDKDQPEDVEQIEDSPSLAVEVIRRRPASIIPISKRSERKAKQDAYKAFKRIEGLDEVLEQVTRRTSRRHADEDYCRGGTLALTSSSAATVPKKRRVSKPKYTCMKCYKRFDQIMVYNMHLLCHDEKEEEQEVEFLEPVDSSQIVETMGKAELEKNGLKLDIMPTRPDLSCNVCGKFFTSPHNLTVHLKTHTAETPGSNNKVKKQAPPCPCTICGKVFKTTSHLKRHMISHTGERKHCCTTCGKMFLKNDHLKRHERTHTSDRPFACEQCGKTFRDKDHLKRHYLTHSDERPYFCEICGKQFKEKNTLQSHQKVHSAAKMICNICGRGFKGEATYKKHLQRHEQTTSHVCEVCGKNFETSGRLKNHYRRHTGARPHHCEECGKQFRDSHSLRLHQKRHTGIGLSTCKECGKDFTNECHLRRHMRVHSGEKPFRCDKCSKPFSRSDNLEAHKKVCSQKNQVWAVQSTMLKSSNSSSLPSMVHSVAFVNSTPSPQAQSEKNAQAEKESVSSAATTFLNILSNTVDFEAGDSSALKTTNTVEKTTENATTTPLMSNLLSHIAWSQASSGVLSASKTNETIGKDNQVVPWSGARSVADQAPEIEAVNLGEPLSLVQPSTSNNMISSSVIHPPTSPPVANMQHSKRILPNQIINVSSTQRGSFPVNPEYIRSRYYAVQSQYPAQPQNPSTSQQYQHVQMPTPLPSNQSAAVQHQAQQLLNFDVNAAVNSFIGYGATL